MALKITIIFGGRQSHFMLVGEEVCKTIADVREFCFRRFPEMKNEQKLRIFWNDHAGDEICIVTDGDYRSFGLSTMGGAATGGPRRLYVEEEKDVVSPKTKEKRVHGKKLLGLRKSPARSAFAAVLADAYGAGAAAAAASSSTESSAASSSVRRAVHATIVCDVCDRQIVGHRYRCLTCHDYDLCMVCEAKYRHKDHIMLRLPRPLVGSRSQAHRVLEQLEQHASLLEMAPEPTECSGPPTANGGGIGANGAAAAAADAAAAAACSRQEKINDILRKNTHMRHHVFDKPALLKGMRMPEVLSRYVDPANIIGERQTPPYYGPRDWPDWICSEAAAADVSHTVRLATDAAKMASEVASSSWNTIRDCAGLFVPFPTPGETPKSPNEQAREAAELAAEKVREKCGDVFYTLHQGVVVADGPIPAASSADGGEKASEKDKERRAEEEKGCGGEQQLQTDSVVGGGGGAGTAVKEHTDCATESGHDDDGASDASSASMLTDDDEDVLEASVAGVFTPPLPPPAAVPWILVDLPEDDGGAAGAKKAVAAEQTGATSSSAAPPSTTPTVVEPSAIPSSPPASEKATATPPPAAAGSTTSPTVRIFNRNLRLSHDPAQHVTSKPDSMVDKLSQMLETSIAQAMGPNATPDTPRTPAQMEKAARLLEQHMRAELDASRGQQQGAQKGPSGSSAASKEKTTQTAPPGASTSSATPPTTTTAANMRATAPATGRRVYSDRPHVNHAIHTMMTMGFSNADDHLTRLLVALDGDIPRALDMLMHQLA